MMNSSDESVKKDLPPELQRVQLENSMAAPGLPNPMKKKDEPDEDIKLPDFLVRNNEEVKSHKQLGSSSIPSNDEPFSPFAKPNIEPSIPKARDTFNPLEKVEDDDDEELGFDVDELVKKIDAKIAELEAEEKKEKEEKEKKKKEEERRNQQVREQPKPEINSINSVIEEKKEEPIERLTTEKPVEEKKEPINLDLEDDQDDDDFFDDFFDN